MSRVRIPPMFSTSMASTPFFEFFSIFFQVPKIHSNLIPAISQDIELEELLASRVQIVGVLQQQPD